jgi:hypothetical protein
LEDIMGKIIGSAEVDPISLAEMEERGGEWVAYQNLDLSSANRGHLQFLKVGEGSTYTEPPEQYPSDKGGLGWRYRYVGKVNFETGLIES